MVQNNYRLLGNAIRTRWKKCVVSQLTKVLRNALSALCICPQACAQNAFSSIIINIHLLALVSYCFSLLSTYNTKIDKDAFKRL